MNVLKLLALVVVVVLLVLVARKRAEDKEPIMSLEGVMPLLVLPLIPIKGN